ncbi:MAG TPA: hypothetical protein VFY79_10115 [Dehalococcoidia bacterium]|jgi:hypothetical protein|nr:hypothetical protein [Dehalococcoidia bacterium]
MDADPVFEKSLTIKPIDHVITVRARPATIRRTLLLLMPWALYIALPEGKLARMAFSVARRVSPLAKRTMH